jgi:hypothetical protein
MTQQLGPSLTLWNLFIVSERANVLPQLVTFGITGILEEVFRNGWPCVRVTTKRRAADGGSARKCTEHGPDRAMCPVCCQTCAGRRLSGAETGGGEMSLFAVVMISSTVTIVTIGDEYPEDFRCTRGNAGAVWSSPFGDVLALETASCRACFAELTESTTKHGRRVRLLPSIVVQRCVKSCSPREYGYEVDLNTVCLQFIAKALELVGFPRQRGAWSCCGGRPCARLKACGPIYCP